MTSFYQISDEHRQREAEQRALIADYDRVIALAKKAGASERTLYTLAERRRALVLALTR